MKLISLLFPKRFSLLKNFSLLFILTSSIVRISLYIWSFSEINFSITNLFKILGTGLFFDIGTLAFINTIYGIYWLIIPKQIYGSWFDKFFVNFTYFLLLFIFTFSLLAEFTFWEEFARRYNFIAVDYLLYTYEVIQNINESYPIPLILLIIFSLVFGGIYYNKKKLAFIDIYNNNNSLINRISAYITWPVIALFFYFFVNNNDAEIFNNRYENEVSKAGVYSFFAAYNNNELDYNEFYPTQEISKSLNTVQHNLEGKILDQNNILRQISNEGVETKPNIVLLCLESLNANFMGTFGNKSNLTPFLDSLANKSILYTNLHATGTRTIRGMEALTLCIPPTPGRSIVKRPNNQNLFTVGEILKQKGYSRNFFYGGDGTFDNMNEYFGNNGFDIIDRPKKQRSAVKIPTKRTKITDDEVTFENAWGLCDGDIYNRVIKEIDKQYTFGKPFFNFVMSNTNHRPYSFPKGHIKEKSGKRSSAIKYADWSLKRFFNQAKNKPWFKNTVFVIVSDHCAYSAGRTALDVKSYHIPGIIYNINNISPIKVDKLCSQIDLLPTLFGYLNWNYKSKIFGKDITKMAIDDERALIANHRKLGYRTKEKVIILDETKNVNTYQWDKSNNNLKKLENDNILINKTISHYQTAYELFKNNQLKIN